MTQNLMELLRMRELGTDRHATAGRAGFNRRVQASIGEWAEQDFLQHCSAQYANLQRNPRSTIAAAFSCDGAVISSTHGDHTIKIVSCESGETLTVLDGHQRTPWVVRFNPVKTAVVASGSLDHAVIVWDSESGQQILQHNFGKPIASVAFHSHGDIMAVASGHKVYSWVYGQAGGHVPAVILKTRKSLRALHFHPLGCPVMLTAEVVERKSSASTSAAAGAAALEQPALDALDAAVTAAVQFAGAAVTGATGTGAGAGPAGGGGPNLMGQAGRPPVGAPWLPTRGPGGGVLAQGARGVAGAGAAANARPAAAPLPDPTSTQMSVLVQLAAYIEAANRATSSREHGTWMRLLLQQRHALQPAGLAPAHSGQLQLPEPDLPMPLAHMTHALQAQPQPLGRADLVAAAAAAAEQQWQQQQQQGRRQPAAGTPMDAGGIEAGWEGASAQGVPLLDRLSMDGSADGEEGEAGGSGSGGPSPHAGLEQQAGPLIPLVPPTAVDLPAAQVFDMNWGWEVSPTASAEALQSLREQRPLMLHRQLPMPSLPEQPCIVNLILWPFSPAKPDRPLSTPLLQLPRTVLCSEMGTCFSRCGRYLAVCVASDAPSHACAVWMDANATAGAPHRTARTGCPFTNSVRGAAPSASSRFAAEGVPPARVPPGRRDSPASTPPAANKSSSGGSPAGVRRVRPGSGAAPAPSTPFSPPAELQFPMELDGEAPGPTPPPRRAPPTPATPGADPMAGATARAPLYELRVYSLDGPTFGCILYARPIRAAHCLTSIQFSPTSRHLLVAYGRRHVSLCSLLVGEGQLTPVHTVVEIYRVHDMRLVRQLAVLEDEVNVAAWHPYPGGGLLYGTKEGKLRLFRHDRRDPARTCIPVLPRARPLAADEELWEAERNAAGRDSHSEDEG